MIKNLKKLLLINLLATLLIFFLHIDSFSTLAEANAPKKSYSAISIKAAYLYNFLQFIEWPENNNDKSSTQISIAFISNNTSAELMEALTTLSHRKIGAKPINVERYESLEQLPSIDYSVVYIDKEMEFIEPRVIKMFEGQPVLTIGESEQFINQGGMIRLYQNNRRIFFDLNVNQSKESGLRIPSKVQRIATRVYR